MAKTEVRRLVVELRQKGKTYSEIKALIPVSKSSLSLWLRNIPLTDQQTNRIKDKRAQTIERYRESMRTRKQNRLDGYFKYQTKFWSNLTERELLLAGLFLYWGEGNKVSNNIISVNNTDPSVMKFALHWIINSLKFPKERIKIKLHLYNDMDISYETDFWSRELNVPKSQFMRPYIKRSNKMDIDQKGFGHGTCNIYLGNTVMKENILMAIKAIGEIYGQKMN